MLFAIEYRKSILVLLTTSLSIVTCQLPDDIQRELNQNLAEQARIQAQRQAHQNQIQSRAAGSSPNNRAGHDPNNYSYQQVSPPIQYSYYQPFGDAAATPQQQTQQQHQQPPQQQQANSQQPVNFDFNNLNFDLPQSQAQVAAPRNPAASSAQSQQQHFTPSFTGAGGLPVMQPIASQSGSYVPDGNPPLQPQARVQQGPPLTEADFKDITGGENYGAPGGNDFGLGDAANIGGGQSAGAGNQKRADNTDEQLREFGMGAELPAQPNRRGGASSGGSGDANSQIPSIPDFGAFGPIGLTGGNGGSGQRQRSDPSSDFGANDFGAPSGSGGSGGGAPSAGGADFDFASQPSSARGDQAASTLNGGAPGSLQSLLGTGFPGLGGNAQSGLDDFARTNPQPSGDQQQHSQRADDGTLDIADLGDKSDGFSGADLGGFEQPSPQNDQDFNYGSASSQQPKSVPYPDSNPQAVGTLLAFTQPQSMTQTRYSAMPDKGSYQDYPAYKSGGNDFEAVKTVVDGTPEARPPGQGRYGTPSSSQLAPEFRQTGGQAFNYAYGPLQRVGDETNTNSADSSNEIYDESPFE